MRRIKLYVHSGFAGADHEDFVEVADETSDKELNDMAEDFMNSSIEYGWYPAEDDE